MPEKAGRALVKMPSETKIVIPDPPHTLCIMASYKIFYTKDKKLEYFITIRADSCKAKE